MKPMDKLAKQLKADAALIEVQVAEELDRRIAASLQGIKPEQREAPAVQERPLGFWWASSLTGITAALAVILWINFQPLVDDVPAQSPQTSPVAMLTTPIIDWKAESAMLTQPLRKELLDLQADIKKAEDRVRRDIGL